MHFNGIVAFGVVATFGALAHTAPVPLPSIELSGGNYARRSRSSGAPRKSRRDLNLISIPSVNPLPFRLEQPAPASLPPPQDVADVLSSSLNPVAGAYQRWEQGCVIGNNIIGYAGQTVAECAALCNAASSCLAFEYGVDYGGGGGYKPQDCYLQSSANLAFHVDGTVAIGIENGCNGGYWDTDLYVKLMSDGADDDDDKYSAEELAAMAQDLEAFCSPGSPGSTNFFMCPSSGGGGLQVSAGASYCQVDANNCVSDGTGNHGDNEACTINVLGAGTLTATDFDTETGYDYVTIGGTRYSGGTGPSNVAVAAGSTFTWRSDSSITNAGFTICWTPEACQDTPGFSNGWRHDCASYVTNGWCADGAAVVGQEWTLGAGFLFPERHCCACGKGGRRLGNTAADGQKSVNKRSDSTSWKYKGKKAKDCNWVKGSKTAKKRRDRCFYENSSGTKAVDACKLTCSYVPAKGKPYDPALP